MTQILQAGLSVFGLAGLVAYWHEAADPNPLRWLALSVLVAFGLVIWIQKGAKWPCSLVVTLCALLLGYSAVSLLWSPDWREGLLSFNKLALLVLLLVLVLHADRSWLEATMPMVAATASLISLAYTVHAPWSQGGMGNINFQAEFLLVIAPLAAAGFVTIGGGRGWFCLIGAFAALAHVFIYAAKPTMFAGLAGLAALIGFWLVVNGFRRIALALAVLSCLAVVLIWSDRVTLSLMQRVELTLNTLLIFRDHVLFGVGLGGFNYAYPSYQESSLWLLDAKTMPALYMYAGAAHNEFAQGLAVFGLAGCGLIAGILIWIIRNRQRDILSLAGLASLSMLAGLSLVGFPLQNASTAILGVVALGALASPGPGHRTGWSVLWPERACFHW